MKIPGERQDWRRTIGIFVLFGPLVPGLLIFVPVTIVSMASPYGLGISNYGFLLMALIGSFAVGFLPALLAGAIYNNFRSRISHRVGHAKFFYASLLGVAAGIGGAFFCTVLLAFFVPNPFARMELFALSLVGGAASGIIVESGLFKGITI